MEGILRSTYAFPRNPMPFAGGPPRGTSPLWDARCAAADMERAGDYIENFTRAHFRALIAQVNPALTPRIVKAGTRDVAVQATPRREAAVQCSLGTRTIAQSPASTAGATQRPRNNAADAGMIGTAPVRSARWSSSLAKRNRVSGRMPQSRGLALYSPVSYGWPRVSDKNPETGANLGVESGASGTLNRNVVQRTPDKIVEAVRSPAPEAVLEEQQEDRSAEKRCYASSALGEILRVQEAPGQGPCNLDTLGWMAGQSGSAEAGIAAATNWPLGEDCRALWDPNAAKEQRLATGRAVRHSHGVEKSGAPPQDKIEVASTGGLEEQLFNATSVVALEDERLSRRAQGVHAPLCTAASRQGPPRDVFVVRMTDAYGGPSSEIYTGALVAEEERERQPSLPVDLHPGDYMEPPCMTLFAEEDEDSAVESMQDVSGVEKPSRCTGADVPPLEADLAGSAVVPPRPCGVASGGSSDHTSGGECGTCANCSYDQKAPTRWLTHLVWRGSRGRVYTSVEEVGYESYYNSRERFR